MTTNRTQESISSCFIDSTAEKIGKTFAYCLIFTVSLIGNTLIGIVVYRTRAMRKTTNYFVVNMAMLDLLLPFFQFPPVLTEVHADSWLISGPLGQALCKLYVFFSHVSMAVSVLSLVLIAVDRFNAVVFPLRPPLISSKMCFFLIPATWIVAMAINSPDLFTFRLVEYSPGKLMCHRQWNAAFGESSSLSNYLLSVFVVFLYIPLVLMAILYTVIVLKLKSQTIPGEPSVDARQQRMKRERNVLKMALAIVLGFAVCWLPFSILFLIRYFAWANMTRFSCYILRLMFCVLFLARANCAINPCICFIFSGNYRQRLKNMFSCFWTSQSHNQVTDRFRRPKSPELVIT